MKSGYYLRDIQTGEYRPVVIDCDPSDADVPEGKILFLREGDEWKQVLQVRKDPHLEALDEVIDHLYCVRDAYEARAYGSDD